MKKVKYFILLVLLMIVVFECYQYFASGGNVIIFLQNQAGYKNENVDYTIRFNDRLLFEGVFDGNETTPMWPMVEDCFGRNTIHVSSKVRNVNITRKIWGLPVKWVVVNFYSDRVEVVTSVFPVFLQ